MTQTDSAPRKIWAHSADSHVLEPADLWTSRLPKRLADRAPRSERGDKYEILYIDGQQIDRQLNDFMDAMRPPGALRPRRASQGPRPGRRVVAARLPVDGLLVGEHHRS